METQKNIVEQNKLVTAIKANDPSVLQHLYQENYKKVEIHIVTNSGSIPQAQDTYQEAFIACYQNIKANKFEPNSETALQGYLFTIAKNKWTDYLRSSQFKKVQGMSEEISATMKDQDSISIENNLEQLQMNATIEAFSRLGNECKELLKLFYYEKKSMDEISAVKNLTSASARNKKYRCIQKLKSLVANPK